MFQYFDEWCLHCICWYSAGCCDCCGCCLSLLLVYSHFVWFHAAQKVRCMILYLQDSEFGRSLHFVYFSKHWQFALDRCVEFLVLVSSFHCIKMWFYVHILIYIEFDGDNVTHEILPTPNQKKNTTNILKVKIKYRWNVHIACSTH